jgi:outer membrane immunogenic protein
MLKKLLLASAASVLMMGAAQAADIEAPPAVYDWTGGYIGIQGGYAWGKTDSETELDPDFDAVDSLDVDDFQANGFVGGAHIGYLLQSDSFVYGIEGDIEYADLKDKVDIDFTDGVAVGDGGEAEKKIDWLGSLRLRAGFAADRALFYATGGLAVGGVSLETDLSPVATGIGLSNDDYEKTKWGWTLGAGVEYAVTDALSARIEYRYTDLGKSDVRVEDADGVGVDGETDNDFHAVRAGLSWHFNQ